MADQKSINILELPAGTRVRLASGALAEITDNPLDGMWVICRTIEPAAGIAASDDETAVFAQDILSVEPA